MVDCKESDKESGRISNIKQELDQLNPTLKQRAVEKFILAALGSIPWVGGFISAIANLKTEEGSVKTDSLQTKWLTEHEERMGELQITLSGIGDRFQALHGQIEERIQSDEYLDVVRKAFRKWDEADTGEKRGYVSNLIVNSAGTRVCSDDVVRLFIDWLGLYHESHFAVIREIFQNPGLTRFDVWEQLYGSFPREDSAEADLFKLLIRDLSTGGVIRQARDTNEDGQFLRAKPQRRIGHKPKTLESAFEDSKPYVLTELGKQFVHYTMNDVVTRLDEKAHS